MANRRDPLTHPKAGDVFSRNGLHWEVDDVTPRGMRYREWRRHRGRRQQDGDKWLWMSRKSFNAWVRQDGVIGRTRAEWAAEMG